MSLLTVVQGMSRQINPDDGKFMPGCKEGDLLLDGKPIAAPVKMKLTAEYIEWRDGIGGEDGKKYIYIVRQGSEFFVVQRPVSAERTGPMLIGREYSITTEVNFHWENGISTRWWSIKAIEVPRPE